MDEDYSSDDELMFSLDKKDTKVWLVKIPLFVAQKWQEPGVKKLGVVRIHNSTTSTSNATSSRSSQVGADAPATADARSRSNHVNSGNTPSGEPRVTLHLPDDPHFQEMPKNYSLTFTQMAPTNEYVFTENHRGQAVGIAGKVEHEAMCGPIIDDAYHAVMQERSRVAVI